MGGRRQQDQDCSLRRSRMGQWGTPAQAAPSPTGTVLQALNAVGRAGARSGVQPSPVIIRGGQAWSVLENQSTSQAQKETTLTHQQTCDLA